MSTIPVAPLSFDMTPSRIQELLSDEVELARAYHALRRQSRDQQQAGSGEPIVLARWNKTFSGALREFPIYSPFGLRFVLFGVHEYECRNLIFLPASEEDHPPRPGASLAYFFMG